MEAEQRRVQKVREEVGTDLKQEKACHLIQMRVTRIAAMWHSPHIKLLKKQSKHGNIVSGKVVGELSLEYSSRTTDDSLSHRLQLHTPYPC